jgi:hypothetical protein
MSIPGSGSPLSQQIPRQWHAHHAWWLGCLTVMQPTLTSILCRSWATKRRNSLCEPLAKARETDMHIFFLALVCCRAHLSMANLRRGTYIVAMLSCRLIGSPCAAMRYNKQQAAPGDGRNAWIWAAVPA